MKNKIDWEKIDPEKWTEDDEKMVSGPFLEESSFATLFPKYREEYLTKVWPTLESIFERKGIKAELNRIEGTMTVRTTKKLRDPYAIIKGRDMLRLLSRGFSIQTSKDIFNDGIDSEVLKIGNQSLSKEKFVKRRQRLIGPNGSTLKALELLTGCTIVVQGKTVAVMGPWKGLKTASQVVLDCMNNVHPVYNIKELMIKRELAKDESLKGESWDRFLPKFKNKNVQRKQPKKKKRERRENKPYSPFPPQPTPRKEDLQMESGEYFLSQEKKEELKKKKIKEKQEAHAKEKEKKREELFKKPKEEPVKMRKEASVADGGFGGGESRSAKEIGESIAEKQRKNKKRAIGQTNDFILTDKQKKSKK